MYCACLGLCVCVVQSNMVHSRIEVFRFIPGTGQSVVRCNRHRWPLYCTYVCDILCDVEVAVLLAKDTSIFVVELLVAKVAGSSYE